MRKSPSARLKFFRPTRQFFTFLLASAAVSGYAQAINIDLDIFGGPPEIGNGAPSDSFGGAAGQPGRWNRVSGLARGPLGLVDVSGAAPTATFGLNTNGGPGSDVGALFAGNTGDFALLLNDAAEVGPTGTGGHYTYTFSGLAPGDYRIYTYAVNPLGSWYVPVPVNVPEAVANQIQVVTGPMPGDAFSYLITHSVHAVSIGNGGGFHIDIVQPPGQQHNFCVNGFQLVPVPEPAPIVILSAGCATALLRCRIRRPRQGATKRIP